MSDPMAFMLWVKGPLFDWSLAIFALGMAMRVFEIFVLGRRHDYSQARGSELAPGFRTLITRTVADPGTFARAPFDVIVGMVWHIGFLIALLLFIPHIELINSVLGLAWPGLPNPMVDAIVAVTIVSLLAVLAHRLLHPVKRHISTPQDYLIWVVTFLPLISGYLAYHRLINPYPLALGIHILTVELFLVLLPFTRLTHIFTALIARWYTGAAFGRKGVAS